MTKTLMALAVAGTLALTAVAAPKSAEARGRGGAIALGVLGGIAATAIIAGAASRSYAGPGYYYGGGGPVYYRGPICHWERRQVWNGYHWRVRRVRVCH